MWRFILVTFAFLGWSFYELSGGADYKPGAQSLQAQMAEGKIRPIARPEAVRVAVIEPEPDGQDEEEVTRTVTTLTDLTLQGTVQDTDRVQVVLAAADAEAPVLPEAEPTETRTKAEILTETEQTVDETATLPTLTDVTTLPNRAAALTVEEFVAASLSQRPALDIRWIDRDVVNMRDGPGTDHAKLGQLTYGVQVEILEDPGNSWVMVEVLETGETGWMADWLLSASN